jgi:glucose-1-phosphate adenylyltransferase
MINSQIFANYLLVQYKSQSLIEHIRRKWVLSPLLDDHFIALVPPQMRKGSEWFQGTSDAVAQNVNLIRDHDPELVIIFGADHIYRMDVRQMVDAHLEKGADVTVAARPVSRKEATAFGVIATDADQRITGFLEKPKDPPHMPGDPARSYVSMGNYIFSKGVLLKALSEAESRGEDDFGKHILPTLVQSHRVFAYDFAGNVVPGTKDYEEQGYWRDVGTIRSFFDAHMDLLGAEPAFDLNNPRWPIISGTRSGASARVVRGEVENCLLGEGSVVNGASLKNSVVRRNVRIEEGAVVENCIIMDNCVISKGCRLKGAIIDKHNILREGTVIGTDPNIDRFSCHVDQCGIAVMPRGGHSTGQRYAAPR